MGKMEMTEEGRYAKYAIRGRTGRRESRLATPRERAGRTREEN